MTRLLEASDVVVEINGKRIVDRVTLSVAPGEIVALVGPNGAGKSTLLRTLSGEIKPSAGTIALGGRAIATLPASELAQCRAMLSQHTTVTFPFTVSEIVRMGASPWGKKQDLEPLVARIMASCDIAHLASQIVTRLSGGEQQRVHFARSLLQLETADDRFRPGLLLLDEPTSSLDLKHQLALLAIVKELSATGCAVIVVIHDLNLAAMIAHRLLMLRGGTLFASGSASEVIDDATLREVFGVADAAGIVPNGRPFVLPHSGRIV
ncbi:heme ABC transporter ATP-binding protein [Pseudorhodoplanes sp.]|jgi:iron complex transport system ATP-binding protein|uniref:heme ABC transporter ATP-binding protein n=1 Tax=Pseudorhodoplanes sp. TaxID=1934341 RepID=UPI002CF68170|nr:heme ABC transporter ATP-binding protein [Pseudorhodoplanes sp.]HWV43071.1 heme ABC transporter ATP-binding protein [Pseudorhodoplanes sp.]